MTEVKVTEVITFVENYIKNVFGFLDIDPSYEIFENEEGIVIVEIDGARLSFLIGSRGTTLDALQHMLALALLKEFDEWQPLLVDINGYRLKRRDKIEDMAKNFIDKVRFFNEEVHMPPMNPYERKQVHEFVHGYHDITSESEGEGSRRHVVLKPSEQ